MPIASSRRVDIIPPWRIAGKPFRSEPRAKRVVQEGRVVQDGVIRGWSVRVCGIVDGVRRVLAIRESSVVDLGEREGAMNVVVPGAVRRFDVHG